MKTLLDQIKDLENTRAAKHARMTEVMQKSIDEGRSTDTAEAEEFDTLKQELQAVDGDLARLRDMEKLAITKAQSIKVPEDDKNPEKKGSELRGPHIIVLPPKVEKGVAFARFVGCMAMAKGNASEAAAYAKEVFPEEKPLHDSLRLFTRMSGEMVAKTAVAAGTTVDATYAAPLVNYQQMSQDFIDWLRPQTILGKIAGLRRVPFNIRVPRQTNGGTASWVGEGKPKPVTAVAFDSITMKYTKLATIAVITDELARFSSPSAELIIRDTLAGAIIQQMDADFIDPDNAGTSDVKPASITNGVTPIASGGNTEALARGDIGKIFAPFIAANMTPQNGVWIMSATTALQLSLMVNSLGQPSFPSINMSGGTFWGMPVVVSQNEGVTDNSANGHIVVLVNASDILLADDGQVTIDVSREASLQMDTAPDASVGTSTLFRSLWQDNLVGIRAERYVNWAKARAQSAQWIASVNWGEA